MKLRHFNVIPKLTFAGNVIHYVIRKLLQWLTILFTGFLSTQTFLNLLSALTQLPDFLRDTHDKLYLSFFFIGSVSYSNLSNPSHYLILFLFKFLLSCVGMFLLWRHPKKSDEEDPLLHH